MRKVLARGVVAKTVGVSRHRGVAISPLAAVASLAVLAGITGCAANRVATNADRCTPPSVEPIADRGELIGLVRSKATDCPIAEAVVVLSGGRETTTDNAGVFRVSGLSAGTYRVRIRRVGFDAATRAVEVSIGRGLTTTWVMDAACCITEDMHAASPAHPWWHFW